MSPDDFIARWKNTGSSERGNFHQFLIELTNIIGVDQPKPVTADGQADDYRFERPVRTFAKGNIQFMDLYRKGCFVMEAKQGAHRADDARQMHFPGMQRSGHGVRGSRRWDLALIEARAQADRYARAVAAEDGWPPFLLVVDIGHVIEVYADFSGQGQGYSQFPDKRRYRIALDDLMDADVRKHLRAIWTDPHALDPSRVSAEVTRGIAALLAELGRSFEGQGHAPDLVARFLMRCLFAMFAEDVRLIPKDSFKDLLKRLRGQPELAQGVLSNLFRAMDRGEPSDSLMTRLLKFNGGLFAEATALPLDAVQLSLLIAAAECNWSHVEPAIFGTLLERALDVRQRHKLGAHYTPRAYVERLVNPVLMEPLRKAWDTARASAVVQFSQGQPELARATIRGFHDELCQIRVLDPACGSGNFLYVALEMMKRLEGEVSAFLSEIGEDQASLGLAGHTIDPHQFLGIEISPWAAAVAEIVLWIGYLQWHFRTYGTAAPSEPVLKNFRNIENRDAVLAYDSRVERRDADGNPVTRWDGIGTVEHPATGGRVPDPQARVQVWDYLKPRPAQWPQADFIVGNPPFIGNKRMREALGDGYTEALRAAYPEIPHSADFVMFWWEKAALVARGSTQATDAARARGTRRFGLITTNSLRQAFNRRVLEPHLSDPKAPLSLVFAIPDHPWIDAGDGAAVRIAMTVAEAGRTEGRLLTIAEERRGETEAEGRPVRFSIEKGTVLADLRIGADVAGSVPLKANASLAFMGVIPVGLGFVLTRAEVQAWGYDLVALPPEIRTYMNGNNLTEGRTDRLIIDFFGLDQGQAQARHPLLYQRVLDTVKPARNQVARKGHREKWWLFGEPRHGMRQALADVPRYIATVETSKHRTFSFLDSNVLPDQKLRIIAAADAGMLAVLSSRHHVIWSDAAGGRQGVGNDPVYNHSKCFDPFPFPDPAPGQEARLRSLGEQLDAHRKAQQAAHPGLTLTGLYNVLAKLRAGERIEGHDLEIYDQGLVGILRDLHDQIDREVAAAYGWPVDLSEGDLLQRLVDLNHQRAAEEAAGLIRWLRPEYQNPSGVAAAGAGGQIEADLGNAPVPGKAKWPDSIPRQIEAVYVALEEMGEATPADIARRFGRRSTSIQPLLEGLSFIGKVQRLPSGRFLAS